jgi:hypothetical protein
MLHGIILRLVFGRKFEIFVYKNLWLTHCFSRVLEIDVGIICACLLCFPAFFHHHKPQKLTKYYSRLTTYLLGSRGTTSGSHSRYTVPQKGGIPADAPTTNDKRHEKDISSYWELDNYSAKIGRGENSSEDIESLPLRQGVNVKRTVEVGSSLV